MNRRGFTLLELLTVMAVLSVLTAIGIGVFFRVSDEWRVSTLRMDLNARAENVFAVMRDDFGQVLSAKLSGAFLWGESRSQDVPLKPRGDGKERERSFQRLEDDRFVIPVEFKNPQTGHAERVSVMYHIDRSGDAPKLMRTMGALGPNPPDGAKQVVAEGVLAMHVECEDGTGWQQNWSQAPLPRAVRVSLTLMDLNRSWEQLSRKETFTIYVK